MNKPLFGTMLFMICVPCFAQIKHDIAPLIRRDLIGLKENFASIQLEAANLDETERLAVYNRHKKSAWAGGLINIFTLGGIGSYYQGDYVCGGIVLLGELLGTGMICVGSVMWFFPIIMIFPLFNSEGQRMVKDGLALYFAGGVTFAASYLFGIIRAFYYPHAYNKTLKTALWPGRDSSTTVSIIPSLNITRDGVEIMLVSLKF